MALTKIIPGVLNLNQANSESGLRMPTGSSSYVAPPTVAEGMMRNDTSQEINGANSAMQHYTGNNEWKNFQNFYPCSTSVCSYPAGAGALALYEFTSDATDTCGNYNGTNDSGITYGSPGQFGNGAQFGGGADRIDIDQALLGSGATKIWSTSMWINTSQTGSEQYLNNTAAAWAQKGYGIYCNTSGYLRFQTSGAASYAGYMSLEDRTMFDGQWHHIVATYSSAGGTNDAYMHLYVDGSDVTGLCTAGGSWSQGGGATYDTFTIPRISLGNWADSATYPSGLYPFVGSMDQIRFFNTALSASQASLLFNERNC